MVNAMATILGDVQYSQNGTVTNPCNMAMSQNPGPLGPLGTLEELVNGWLFPQIW